MNPHRFKVKGFVAVQYRSLWFGNYRAVGSMVESRLLLAGGCTSAARMWCVVRQAHHEGSGLVQGQLQSLQNILTAALTLPHGELVEPRTEALCRFHQIPLQNVVIFID